MIFIPEVIGRVIDSMREQGNYTSWSKVGQVYTVIADNELLENEWVTITGINTGFPYTFPFTFTNGLQTASEVFGTFQVSNVTSTSFDVTSSSDLPLSGTYKSLEPYYMFGHRQEIANRLNMKDKDKLYKFQKYPLFVLRLDFPEDVTADYVHNVSLNMAILAFTDKNYRAEDRYEFIFKPILMPLYFEFFEALQNSSELMNIGRIEHTKIDRMYFGVEELSRNTAHIFNDPLDAIELQNLNLKLLDNNC
jgi:hypothetical protein